MTAFNESLLPHAGSDRTAGAASVPPIVAASVFASWGEPYRARAYGRNGNPTWEALEQALGAIEDARALVFSSGQAASMALMLALTEGRERLVMPADGYFSTRTLANRLRPNGVEPVYVDLQDLAQVERELAAGPSVLWAETPTNPLLRVADLARLGELAAAAGAPMAADNTVATRVLQQPLRGCHPGDACADRCHDDHHPVRHSAAEPTTAGAHAQHAKHVARHSHPDRIADEKLSGSSRGVTTDG